MSAALGIATTESCCRTQFRATWFLLLPSFPAISSRTLKDDPRPLGIFPWPRGLYAIRVKPSLWQYCRILGSTLLSIRLYSTWFETIFSRDNDCSASLICSTEKLLTPMWRVKAAFDILSIPHPRSVHGHLSVR